MRIAEYKRIDTRIEKRIVHHDIYDEETGEITGGYDEEIVTKEIPIMGMVYRDATPEEEAQYAAEQAEMARIEAMREPTPEEQLRADVDFIMAMEGLL